VGRHRHAAVVSIGGSVVDGDSDSHAGRLRGGLEMREGNSGGRGRKGFAFAVAFVAWSR
jgi:hypothetical protein